MAVSPFAEPHAGLVAAACRAGALGVLDLGLDPGRARTAIADVARWWPGPFGVRAHRGTPPMTLPPQVRTVVLAPGADWPVPPGCQVIREVTTVAQARDADAFIARGNESGGRVSEQSTFVL